jgi:hypothetical protein
MKWKIHKCTHPNVCQFDFKLTLRLNDAYVKLLDFLSPQNDLVHDRKTGLQAFTGSS